MFTLVLEKYKKWSRLIFRMKAVISLHVLYLIITKTLMVRGDDKCESKVELRAVLLSCPIKDSGCDDDDLLSQTLKSEESQILQANSKNFDSLKENLERGFPNAVKDCKRKLVVTLRVRNVGKIPCDDEYIVVDHVFDPVTGGRGRLLSPIVVKLRQEQMIQLYGLQFQRAVNGDPFEEQKASDKTCSLNPENPTCGFTTYDGKPIPFSEGFCCSSDSRTNSKRQSPPEFRDGAFLNRDSKLILQGSSRFSREGTVDAIMNPKLVKIRSGSQCDFSGEKKSVDRGGIGDPLSWEEIPNYLLELDRKIVCDRGDFMNELCRLREEKNEAESFSGGNGHKKLTDTSNNEGEETSVKERGQEVALNGLKITTVAVNAESHGAGPLIDETSNGVALLKNFIRALDYDRSSSPETVSDDSTQGNRGKRENRNENTNLSLEEKLERFANSKRRPSNRRKRLLEISHKRFRNVNQSGDEQSPETCTPDDYAKSAPPKYFFSHDKFIIDPLESSASSSNSNSSCDPMKDQNYESNTGDKSYDAFSRKGEKPEKISEHFSFHKQPKKENTINSQNTYEECSAERAPENEEEKTKMEKSRNQLDKTQQNMEPFKESKGFALFGKNQEHQGKEEKDGSVNDYFKDQKNRLITKNLKSLFHKTDSDKKSLKPRLRNFFSSKSREKQKSKSESVKNNKELDVEGKNEHRESKKYNEMKNERDEEETEESAKAKGKVKEDMESSEKLKNFRFSGFGNNKYGGGSFQYLPRVEPKQKLEKSELEKNFLKQFADKELDSSRIHYPKDTPEDVDFNVEIIRHLHPDFIRSRHHSGAFNLLEKNQASDRSAAVRAKINEILERTKHPVRLSQSQSQSQFQRHQIPQRYYLLDDNHFLPPEVYVVNAGRGRSPDAEKRQRYLQMPEPARDRSQLYRKSYMYKKPVRRYYMYEDQNGNEATQRSSFTGGRFLKAQLRGKRYLKDHQRSEKGRKNVGRGFAREKSREKRSTSYGFQPARGFLKSDIDLRNSDGGLVHVLKTCSVDTGPGENEERQGKVAGWEFSQLNRENLSMDANVISSLQRLQSRFNFPILASGEIIGRETMANSGIYRHRLIQSYLNAPDYVLKELENSLKGKRQVNQGSEGEEKYTFAGEYLQDTARCMRYGDLWYGMYMIKKPMVAQSFGIQLFDKHSLCDGTSQWRDLTKGKMVRIGTFLTKAEDDLPTISITFLGGKAEKVKSTIDPDNYLLLIPSHVSDPSKVSFYPQIKGGPDEYLLVSSKDVSAGGECDMVGTSFEAFAHQPDRCGQKTGSCLKRQPVDLWREDMEARIRGKRGKYFLENFGVVPNSSVKTYTNLTGEFLALEYYGEYTSTIEIEVKADSNAIIRKGSNAQIPLVYIDSTYPKKTRIILSVLNIGLTSSYFRPRLGDCPPDLDPAWCPLEGPLVTIPPQQRHDFKLDLSGNLPNGHTHLSVQVLNQQNKKIAHRKILIKKGDRCVCAFHCRCNCIGNLVDGKICRRLSLEEYRKAGYIGSFPFRGGAAASASESILGNAHIVILTTCYILLFLGVLKGVLGIFFRKMGIVGIRVISGPREICEYYECELKGCTVLYDEYGFPVHPTTCLPVQIVPLWLETLMNFFFFFLYPMRGIWYLIMSLPCCRGACYECDAFRPDDSGRDHKCSSPLLPKDPQPTCVHYTLTTVSSRKSKPDEFLPYTAYKGDDDPLEEDDTEFVLQEMKKYKKN